TPLPRVVLHRGAKRCQAESEEGGVGDADGGPECRARQSEPDHGTAGNDEAAGTAGVGSYAVASALLTRHLVARHLVEAFLDVVELAAKGLDVGVGAGFRLGGFRRRLGTGGAERQ